jgi:uncharacterized membrane protein YkvA (DUF1232 family)
MERRSAKQAFSGNGRIGRVARPRCVPVKSERALGMLAGLREDLGTTEINALRRRVREHYDALLEAQRTSELIAIDLAELLSMRLEQLLAASGTFTGPHRAAVVGAARYFVSNDDAVPDDQALTGLDDDVAVFNAVAREIGRSDLLIED